MDPAVAALIGAGTAAAVSLLSQFLAHSLSLRRDQRNQHRQRLTDAVVEAAFLLYEARDRSETFEEFAERISPDSVAAQDPELYWELGPTHESISRGIVLLQVHLGHDHPLLEDYVEIATTVSDAERKWHMSRRAPEEERIESIPELARTLRNAQLARDRWMKAALAELQRV